MNDNIIKQAHPRIPKEFWEAMLNIHNHFYDHVRCNYYEAQYGKQVKPVLDSFRVLDCWLDIAIEEGWLD